MAASAYPQVNVKMASRDDVPNEVPAPCAGYAFVCRKLTQGCEPGTRRIGNSLLWHGTTVADTDDKLIIAANRYSRSRSTCQFSGGVPENFSNSNAKAQTDVEARPRCLQTATISTARPLDAFVCNPCYLALFPRPSALAPRRSFHRAFCFFCGGWPLFYAAEKPEKSTAD